MRSSFLGNEIITCSRCGREEISSPLTDPNVKVICSLCVQKMLMALEKNHEIDLEEIKAAIRARKLRARLSSITGQELADPLSLDPNPCFYELSAIFRVTHNRWADLDNYLKSLKDALKWSGLIKDDSQIISYGPCKLIKQAPAGSVSIILKPIKAAPHKIASGLEED